MLKDGYTPTEAMVYGYLWWVTWKTAIQQEISPSFWLMQKALNIGRASISRWINKLEERWLISVARGYKERNTYFVMDMNMYPPITNFDENKMWGGPKWNTGGPKWNR